MIKVKFENKTENPQSELNIFCENSLELFAYILGGGPLI